MTERSIAWCYEMLEISPDASMNEVERAYRLLRRIYNEPTTVGLVPGLQEFNEETRRQILEDLTEAYLRLKDHLHVHKRPPSREIELVVPDRPVNGAFIRSVRETTGFTLDDAAEKTNIRKVYLEAIEEEQFDRLPAAVVYVRGFVRAYLEFLNIQVDRSLDSYMERYRDWESDR